MVTYAVYRVLYGEDFIKKSILSILDFVDKVFVFYTNTPWGNIDYCIYKGEKIIFPKKFDAVIDIVNNIESEKIITIENYIDTPYNQFSRLVNEQILLNYKKPNIIIFMEPDYIFNSDMLKSAFKEHNNKDIVSISTRQVELWKTSKYCVPERPARKGVIFWNMNNLETIPMTGTHAETSNTKQMVNSYVHNFGFCVSEKSMYWKHLLALGFSKKIGDGMPNEYWYDKWLNWKEGDTNLEISSGHESDIPFIVDYSQEQLPELMQTW